MNNEMKYQSRRHPIAAFLCLLTFGPLILAAMLAVIVGYVVAAIFLAVFGREDDVIEDLDMDEARW